MNVSDRLCIVRRIDSPPAGERCHTGRTCPSVFELLNDLYAVVGRKAQAEIARRLRPLRPGESVVVIPSQTLFSALSHIKVA